MKETLRFKGGLTRLWWIPLITGLVCIGFGIWCLLSPGTSLPVFSYIFAAAMCAAGVLNLGFAAINSSVGANWGWSMALGILEVACGVWLFTLPEAVLTTTFMIVIGIWVLVVAINSICEACLMASYSAGWIAWMVILLLATVVFGFIFLSSPVAGGIAVWLWLGLSLITFGTYRMTLAFQLKSINKATRGFL